MDVVDSDATRNRLKSDDADYSVMITSHNKRMFDSILEVLKQVLKEKIEVSNVMEVGGYMWSAVVTLAKEDMSKSSAHDFLPPESAAAYMTPIKRFMRSRGLR